MRLQLIDASGYYLKTHHVSLVNTPQLSGECQDECGIRTVPDPFFSLPNDKEKKAVWPRDTSTMHLCK